MSGGHFDYRQYELDNIALSIERIIEKNGRKKTREELKSEGWRDPDWYEKYPEDLYHYKYPDEVVEKFKEAVKVLKQAQVYAHRVDWLLSGDDGNETFLRRLQDDLNELESNNKNTIL